MGCVDDAACGAGARLRGDTAISHNAGAVFVLGPAMHFSIAGLLLHVVQKPYWLLNWCPVVWLGKISYSLHLWQQPFVFGERGKPTILRVLRSSDGSGLVLFDRDAHAARAREADGEAEDRGENPGGSGVKGTDAPRINFMRRFRGHPYS